MKSYIKNGAKVFYNYVVALIMFVIFIYLFMSITKDNFNALLPFYSLLMFLLAFLIIYSDMKRLAIKEKVPQYELNPYPFKGLVYGLIGSIPIAFLVSVAELINTGSDIAERIKHVAINTFLGPLYFLIRWLNESPIGYISAILLLPLIAMLGYLAGYYGIDIASKLKKEKPVTEKSFTKSPWNPSNASGQAIGKKKKKKKKDSGGL